MRSHPVLAGLQEHGIKLGLERIKQFLATLGDPHLAFPVIHIGGTNGKGSVCAMVTRALVEAGFRVGTNLSPHLEHINERFLIDGVPVDDASLNEVLEAVDRARWDFAGGIGAAEAPLTYFEMVTSAAFLLFAQRAVDVAVIEVGLGGRLDATNVVKPLVTGVVSIGLDHMDRLGETIPEIAGEKAGIFKRGVRAVIGNMPPEATAVFDERARGLGIPLWRPGGQMRRERGRDGWRFSSPEGTVGPVRLAMEGLHQGANAAVAVGVLHQLRLAGIPVSDDAIAVGLREGRIAGRLERLAPKLLVDGAHNIDGTRALAAFLTEQPRPGRRILAFGCGEDRDPKTLIAPLLPLVDEVVAVTCDHPKARPSMDLANALEGIDRDLSEGGRIEEVIAELLAESDETIVAGSLYLVGALRTFVRGGGLAASAQDV
jgi:dihydrofolate synthase/folylpolyglutamate synthase